MIPTWFPADQFEELRAYQDFHILAQGGFGEIYVVSGEGESSVILKRLKPQWVKDALKREAFEMEARFLKKLHHPQIPQYLDGFISDEECFFIPHHPR